MGVISMDNKLMESAFSVLIQNSKDLVFVKDNNLVYRHASMPFVKMAGKKSLKEVVGHTDSEIFEDKSLSK